MNLLNRPYAPIAAIFILSLLIFLPRLDSLPFRGEEPRRVISAHEMMESGNWVVPTIQNQVFLSRPPLQNWIIAGTGVLRGSFDHLTGRLPSIICALLTALLIYYYCITRLSRGTALLASLFFLTMPQVIQLGRTAETELMFTFFLTGSFLLWHRGELKNWPGYLKWLIAYIFLACATLTKGINQAPVYFAAIIGLHLLLNRQVKTLFSAAHLSGFAVFFLIVGWWQWAFIHYVGAKTGWLMHAGDVGMRFEQFGFKQYLEHGFVFPFELVAVMLPWSIFLMVFFTRSYWKQSLNLIEKPIVLFCLGAILITFFSVWLPPGSRTRYYMPLFPCFAILAAIAVQTLATKKKNGFTLFLMISMPLAGFINLLLSLFEVHFFVPPEPLANALLYCLGTMILSIVIVLFKRFQPASSFYASIICYALFAALTIGFIYTDSRKATYNDVESQVLTLLNQLPNDTNMVSIEPVAFDFLYYYILYTGHTIPVVSRDWLLNQKDSRPQFFCAWSPLVLSYPPSLALKVISEIKTGRYKNGYPNQPKQSMTVGALIPA